ncbi:MAG TPA: hypothetical protein VG847_11855 [Chitinophagaceae bacterium]|nr:hypothetical protein [Chitinophagaceae bacterium]
MRKKILLIFLTLIACVKLHAQQKKIHFRSIGSLSYFIGQSRNDWGFQIINGIAFKNYFSGIGVGADYYYYNSYPLFFDQRVYVGKKRILFGYGDLGYNFNNGHNKPGKEAGYYTSYRFSGGLYTNVGMGIRIPLKNKRSFLTFSAGFAYKELHNTAKIYSGCLAPLCPVDYQHYHYDNGRVDLKAGVDF